MRNYKGVIYNSKEYNLPEIELEFVSNGYWVGYGNKHITSYELIDKSIEEKLGFHFQFTRTTRKGIGNVFFVETQDKIY